MGSSWPVQGMTIASDSGTQPRAYVCEVLRDSDATDTIFLGVAWSPDGHLLACGSFLPSVQVWDMTTRSRRWVETYRADFDPSCGLESRWDTSGRWR